MLTKKQLEFLKDVALEKHNQMVNAVEEYEKANNQEKADVYACKAHWFLDMYTELNNMYFDRINLIEELANEIKDWEEFGK